VLILARCTSSFAHQLPIPRRTGQQRTISICQYVEGDFAFKGRYFHNLQADEKERILNYPLMVYACSGPDSESIDHPKLHLDTKEWDDSTFSAWHHRRHHHRPTRWD